MHTRFARGAVSGTVYQACYKPDIEVSGNVLLITREMSASVVHAECFSIKPETFEEVQTCFNAIIRHQRVFRTRIR